MQGGIMKKIFSLMLVLGLAVGMTSCSNKKVKKDEKVETKVADEELNIDDSDFIVDADEKDEMTDEADTETVADASDEMMDEKSPVQISGSEVYEVQKGETLMWIAFKLYGDYRKWKDLQAANQDVVADGVQPGDRIKYSPSEFAWNPKGLPHLIKRGETLGTISSDKYGTEKKWRKIWDNNKEMIRDPNLIFAGFTLYYTPEERELASDQM
jgi:nucleoid-associated protein YgaU